MNRVIISRKGFDSSTGKTPAYPSPIYKDGRIFSIPIHMTKNSPPDVFGKVNYQGFNAFEVIQYIYSFSRNGSPYSEKDTCHFDPNLSVTPGLFGQAGDDQRELEKGGVSAGDLFLFFGFFRNYSKNPSIKLNRGSNGCHHFFGWLQIEEIISGTELIRDFCENLGVRHPHGYGQWANNTLYVGSRNLISSFGELRGKGSGLFPQTHGDLILSDLKDHKKSMWKMPEKYFRKITKEHEPDEMFVTRNLKPKGPKAWFDPDNLLIDTNRGNWQELVLDGDKFPSIEEWAHSLIKKRS